MLLIRSQDKEILVPLNRPVYITGHEVIYCEEIESSQGSLLGNYASKDRCIEIIDEMQETFKGNWGCCVYQMPPK